MTQSLTVTTEDGWNPRLLASLSYLGLLCLVPLLVNKDDEFVAFHAKQGLILWVWAVIALVLVIVPGAGPVFFKVSSILIPILSVIGMVSVMLNKAWMLPLVYALAKKI